MAVLHPLKVVISNLPTDFPKEISVPDFPANEAKGSHPVSFGSTLYIEKEDFKEVSRIRVKKKQKDVLNVFCHS